MNRPAKFNTKAFISFLTVFIWMILLITGIVLYFTPPGRVANWVDWRFLGLLKEEWQAIHTVFSFIFIIIGALHLYYNWVVFWSYLKSKVAGGIKMRKELIWSSSLVMVTLLLILLKIPPFQMVVDFGEFLSNSWNNEQSEPPVPHAELLTLSEYADKADRDLVELTRSLNHLKIQPVDTLLTIREIAEMNGLSPRDLIVKISDTNQVTQKYLGYGRKTFLSVCQELGISQEKALQRLTEKDILMKPDETLKEIAERSDMKPIDIINIIKGESSE